MWKSIPEPAATSRIRLAVFTPARLAALAGLVICLGCGLLVTLPHSPANMPYVLPDGGMFLYFGQRLLEGAAPYRDVWDNKPPLIYFLNAAGLWLGGGARWGVWAFEALAVSTASVLSYDLLRRAFGVLPAILATVMWLLSFLFLAQDGNMTETFALPLQFGCVWLAYRVEIRYGGEYRWRGLLFGILLGLIFELKTNEIGVGLAVAAYLLLRAARTRAWRDALINLAWIAVGALLAIGAATAVLAAQGVLADYWLAVFVSNAAYAARFDFWASRFDALTTGYQYLAGTGLALFGLVGAVIGINGLLWARARISPSLRPLLAIAALALPVEIILVTTTGRSFDHYYLALFYVLAVWAAFSFWFLFRALDDWLGAAANRARFAVRASLTLVLALTLIPAAAQDVALADTLHQLAPPAIVPWLGAHTTPADTVLVLGYEPRILFFAERRAPTRFVSQTIFELPRFVTPALADEFFNAVVDGKPKYIVDVRGNGLTNFTGVDDLVVRRRLGALQKQYKLTNNVGGYRVYARVGNEP